MKSLRILYQSFTDEKVAGLYWEELRALLRSIADPGTTVDIKGITPQSNYAHAIVELHCAREVTCNAIEAQNAGYDAFVIGHFQDAGLYEARAAVDIPVIALGEASMLHACTLGQQIAVLATSRRMASWCRMQAQKYGLENRITRIAQFNENPLEVLSAYRDEAKAAEIFERFAAHARAIVSEGADVLLPGCGLSMLLFSRQQNHVVDRAPVVNGIPVAVKMAEMAVRLKRLTGLGVSRTSDFETPPPEVLAEFMRYRKPVH
jgi:allantoin racemase